MINVINKLNNLLCLSNSSLSVILFSGIVSLITPSLIQKCCVGFLRQFTHLARLKMLSIWLPLYYLLLLGQLIER